MLSAAKYYKKNELESGIDSSSPVELIVLVYEKVIENLNLGQYEMRQGFHGIEPFTKASNLINYGLLAPLNFDKGKEIAENLKNVYEWSLREIISARLSHSPEKVQKIIDVLTPLYEAWLAIGPARDIRVLSDNFEVGRDIHKNHELMKN